MKTKYWPSFVIGGLWAIGSGIAFRNIIWVIIGIFLFVYGLKLRRFKKENNIGGNLKWHLAKKQNEM